MREGLSGKYWSEIGAYKIDQTQYSLTRLEQDRLVSSSVILRHSKTKQKDIGLTTRFQGLGIFLLLIAMQARQRKIQS